MKPKEFWGAPKKFSFEALSSERKVSWLELFYDLVYVTAISTITHAAAHDFTFENFLSYFYLIALVFWGWVNGSLYYDLHGTNGLRTKLMTFWQMASIAAFSIVMHSSAESLIFNVTLVLMVIQLYITYLWWSVGYYDKEHRKYNLAYTVCYLISLGLMFITLFLPQPYIRILFYISLIFNYLPPFIVAHRFPDDMSNFILSKSMLERFGLFTIIIFGELVLGVINGVIATHHLNAITWLNFILALSIVFMLWWTFFTLTSEKEYIAGFNNNTLFELCYFVSILSLGLISISLKEVFTQFGEGTSHFHWSPVLLVAGLSTFFLSIVGMLQLMKFPKHLVYLKAKTQIALLAFSLLAPLVLLVINHLCLTQYFAVLIVLLLVMSIFLGAHWLHVYQANEIDEELPLEG